MLTRRSILWGLIAAPAIVRASSLMPVRAWLEAPKLTMAEILARNMRYTAARLAENVMRNNALLSRLKERGAIYTGYEPIVWHEEMSWSASSEIERIRSVANGPWC